MITGILEDFDRLTIGVGSAQFSNTPKNPFTYEERRTMIIKSLEREDIESYEVVRIDDTNDHSIWVSHVESIIPEFGVVFSNDPVTVQLFREKGYDVREPPLHRREDYSGTEVRKRMVDEKDWESLVPEATAEFIREIGGARRVREIASSKRS